MRERGGEVNKPVFQLGQTVFTVSEYEKRIPEICPDCLGTRVITVILATDEQHIIDCDLCKQGWEGSTGRWEERVSAFRVEEQIVTGVELLHRYDEYADKLIEAQYICNHSRFYDYDVFATREEASLRGEEMIQKYNERATKSISTKYDHKRNWAWHVRYHRENIRRAEKDIVYNKSKLAVALVKAKEDKEDSNAKP